MTDPNKNADTSFLTDVQTLRARARKQIEDGVLTPSYDLDPRVAVELLNTALATELICVLRYRQHALVATGLEAEPVAAELAFSGPMMRGAASSSSA